LAEWDELVEAMPGPATREHELPTLSQAPGPRAQQSAPPALEDFVYRSILGAGGMGIVYRAQQLSLLREVGIKFLLAEGDPDRLTRFQREAHTLASLTHPGIVSVHATGVSNGRPYIVMEYLPGGSLSTRLAKGPLSPTEAVEILIPVCRAIEEVHHRGFVHRDLKPGNILFTSKGQPKVADFGLAKWLEEASQTRTGALLGTPSFMAPEQAGSDWPLGPAADIWALGVVLYVCLVGKPPFQGSTDLATAKLVCEAEPAPMPETVPLALQHLCMRCLRKNPTERFASARELADELERWQRGEQVRTGPPPPTPSSLLSRRNLLLAGIATVPLAGVVFWLGLRPREGKGAPLPERFPINGKLVQPRWGTENLATQKTVQGEYLVDSASLGLLQLLPDPGMDRYRFRVEVRHHRSNKVGIFVGLRTHRETAHRFVRLQIDDIVCEGQVWEQVRARVGPEGIPATKPLNRISLAQCAVRSLDWNDSLALESFTSEPGVFKAFGQENGPFRTLEIEVDRNEVRGRMIGSDRPGVARLTFEQLRERVEARVKELPEDDPRYRMDSSFAPRGGLGIFVFRGVAGFRNATLEEIKAN
jgi:serine/threonine protein kinase